MNNKLVRYLVLVQTPISKQKEEKYENEILKLFTMNNEYVAVGKDYVELTEEEMQHLTENV